MLAIPELVALLGEILAWGLLTIAVVLLGKLISKMHFSLSVLGIGFEPLGWLADALSSYILAGAEDARQAVQGALEATFHALVWSLNETYGALVDLANATKGALVYLWQHVVKPWVNALVAPIRPAVSSVESKVAALTTTVATNLTKAESYAKAHADAAFTDAETFTRTEVSAARAAAVAAEAQITARLDGIGTQAEALAGSIAAAPDAVWGDLRKLADVQNLADGVLLGVAGALGIKALTDATGLSSDTCEQNQKQVCNADPGQWLKLLEGIALLGVLFDFKLCYDFAETILGDVGDLVVAIEDKAWGEFS